ncbi:MAG TPA: GAF domain-containing sensor histidine kinase [Hyphomicrobiaceae bacterium]|nr:GAF domain-containing sensor histidine kinase [Hyphomicrobiaceae bacterium]
MIDLQRDIAAIARIDVIPTVLDVVCRVTGMGFAAVSRVTEDRWIACAVRDDIAFGLQPGGELKVETTICNEIRGSGQPAVIDHVSLDHDFCGHPTPQMYGFQSYISMPIFRRNGAFFGTLCAIDPKPAKLKTPHVMGMFRLFADLIGFHLEAQERLESSEAALLDERQTSELREQFIAVLGHDLRNPLAAIDAGTRLLGRSPQLDDKTQTIVAHIQDSVRRMGGLIDNVLDLARSRLGGGLSLDRSIDVPLGPVLEQVVNELRAGWPGRRIDLSIDLPRPVNCDPARIAQLLSNLLGNALKHGADDPVSVRASVRDGMFELSVANRGDAIPPEVIQRIFEPFYRPLAGANKEGLGLGLYIASAIAHAHRGTLDVASTEDETSFVFRMPAR